MTAVLEHPRTETRALNEEALIEEARGRQQQRRALVGFLALLMGAVLALPVVAGDGSGSGAERFGDRLGPLGQRLTITPGPPQHTLTSVLYVGFSSVDGDPRPGQIDAGRAGRARLMATFRTMLTTRSIVRQAVVQSGVRRSVGDVVLATTATTPRATNLIEVSVTDRRAATARRLANAIATVFVEQINILEPRDPRSEQVVSVYDLARETP